MAGYHSILWQGTCFSVDLKYHMELKPEAHPVLVHSSICVVTLREAGGQPHNSTLWGAEPHNA